MDTTDEAAPALRVRDLHRSYGTGSSSFEAVRGVDLEVARGSVTALLGTNGAGKTSTLEVLEGLARPSAGEVEVLGLDPWRNRAEVRRRTGVLLQSSGFSGDLTLRETLQMWASTVTAPTSVEAALAMLDLEARAGTRVRSLSGGELRRLDLACTLMGEPELVLLDEPTTGLDPESRRAVWGLIEQLRERGASVLITTHYLEEAEALADRVSILHAGRVVREGSTVDIVADHPSRIGFTTPDGTDVPTPPGSTVRHERDRTVLETPDLQGTLTALLDWAARRDVRLEGLSASTASLESVFLEIADGSDDRTSEGASR